MAKDHQTVLFLSTGNFYRSRFAEACFNFHAVNTGVRWKARSRGFRPYPASENLSQLAVNRLKHLGIPLSHTAQAPCGICESSLVSASLVVALYEQEHRPFFRSSFPKWEDRCRYWNVPDIDELDPASALPKIEAEVEALVYLLRCGHASGLSEESLVEF